jgi:hypothetical protein
VDEPVHPGVARISFAPTPRFPVGSRWRIESDDDERIETSDPREAISAIVRFLS